MMRKNYIVFLIIILICLVFGSNTGNGSISEEELDYYKDLINHRIDIDSLYEGSFGVHFIDGDNEVYREFISYPAIDTILYGDSMAVESVMTYYKISLSPTRQSMLLQEFLYPKQVYNKIKQFYDDNSKEYINIGLNMISVLGTLHKPLSIEKITYIDYKGETHPFLPGDQLLFDLNNIHPIARYIYNKYGNHLYVELISDSLILVTPTASAIYDSMRLYDLNGEIIYSSIAKIAGTNNICILKNDTLYFSFQQSDSFTNSSNENQEKRIKVLGIYNDTVCDSFYLGNTQGFFESLLGISKSSDSIYCYIKKYVQKDLQIERINILSGERIFSTYESDFTARGNTIIINHNILANIENEGISVYLIKDNEINKFSIEGRFRLISRNILQNLQSMDYYYLNTRTLILERIMGN